MAGKVNTKFVTILVVVLGLLVAGVAVFYLTVVRQSTAELVAQGNDHLVKAQAIEIDPTADREALTEAYQQRGQEFRRAAQFYGRAWNRDGNDVDILLKYLEAYGQMTVRNSQEAQDVLRQVYSLSRQSTELREDDDQLENFYQTLFRWGQELSANSFFNDLRTLTATRLETHPDNVVARKYNGITRAMRLSDDMDRGEQQAIREMLEGVLQQRPDDTDVLHYLGLWHHYDARRIQQVDPRSDQADQARQQTEDYARRALEADPDNPRVKLEFLTLILRLADLYQQHPDPALQQRGQELRGEALPVLEALETDLRQNPESALLVQRIAEILPRVDRTPLPDEPNRTRGLRRTEELLREAANRRPDILIYRLMLGNILKLQLKLDEAHEQYRLARDHEVMGDFISTLRDESLRQQAVYEVANIELIRAEAAEDPDRRAQILTDADTAVDELEKVTDQDYRVLMLRGKIAMLRGQNTRAMQAIDQAAGLMVNAGRTDNLIEAYLLSARARQQEKQWGAAAERLEQVLEVVESSPREDIRTNIRLQFAEMLIRSRRFDVARQQLEAVLEDQPRDLTALQLLATWYAEQDQPERAIEILEATGLAETNPRISRRLAAYYQAAGQGDQSRAMVLEQAEKNPADLALLQQALGLTESTDEKLALLDRAQQAGADPNVLAILRRPIESDGQESTDLRDMLAQTASATATPTENALRDARVYLQFGRVDDARQAFETAQQLEPDHDQVLLMALDFALLDQRFEEARRLVAEAGKRNLDLADGHFLRGKLALAEDKIRQAIASYEQGLRLRPIFDDGWRQFGEIHLRNGDPEAAINAFNTALNQRPDNTQALVSLAAAHDALGQRPRALEALATAVRYAPNDTNLLNQYLQYEARHGNPQRVIQTRQEIAESRPGDANNRLALAALISQQGQHQQALDLLDELENDPAVTLDPALQRNLAAARATTHRAADQIDAGQQVIQDYLQTRGEQTDTEDYLLLARYQVSSGRVPQGLDTYRQAVAQEPADNDRPAARELADVLFNFNQTQDAAAIYRQLFDQTQDPEVRQRVGLRLAEAQLRLQQTDQARAVLDQLEPSATGEALRGMIAAQNGNRQQAIDFVNASLGRDSQNALTYYQRAVLLSQDPETQAQALRDTAQALALSPDMAQALALQANLQLQAGRPDEAARTLRRLLETAPGNNQARLQLTQLYLSQQRTDDAADLIDDGLAMEPQSPLWLMARANLATSRGDLDQAVDALEQVMDASPNAQALSRLALLYLQQDRPAPAAALLDEHPTLLSENPLLQAVRGRSLAAQGQTEPAQRVFTLALQRAGSAAEVSQILRQMFEALGSDAAVELAQSVQHPQQPLWIDTALAGVALSDRDYDTALSRLRALDGRLDSADPATRQQVRKMQALALLQTGDHAGARDAYRQLLDEDPDNLEVLNNLAFILASHLDDPQAAVPLAERARQLAPDNAEILDTLGWTYYQVDRPDDARRALEQSVEARALPANTYHLGRLYHERNNPERARSLLTQSLQLAEAAGDREFTEKARNLLQQIP